MRQSIFISLITLITLLLTQCYWLHNIYNVEKEKIQNLIEERFQVAIKTEMSKRSLKGNPKDPNNPKWIIKAASEMTPEEIKNLKGDTISLEKAEKNKWGETIADVLNQRVQDGLLRKNRPLRVAVLDSIFSQQLVKKNLIGTTQVLLYDSARQVVDQVGTLPGLSRNRFQTPILPIGTRGLQFVQASVELPPFLLIQRMLLSLIISGLIIIISMICLYLLLRTIQKAHTQLREREIAVHSAIHDLKSPLNTAYAAVDFIASGEKEPIKTEILQTGKTQIRRLTEIIESMLSLLKAPDGYSLPKRSEVDIALLIEQTFKAIIQLYPDKKHVFRIERDAKTPLILYTDPVRLERCLRNLLENALKYSDNDVKITTRISVNGDHLQIAIQDTGWGVPKKAQKKLGQQFFRVKQADKPPRSGYGLGLSSVKLLTKEMGGTLTFHSKEGVGSAFIINLPLHT